MYNKVNDVVDMFNEFDVKIFFIETSKIKFNCRRCDEIFLFNNKFYYYFKRCKKFVVKSKVFRNFKSKIFRNFKSKDFFNFTKVKIIRSFVSIDFKLKFDFKFWRYVKLKININFFKLNDLIIIYIDFDCEFSLIDW